MRVVIASSEFVPLAKTGGLADVIGPLAREMCGLGHDVIVFLPFYKSMDVKKWQPKTIIDNLEISLGSEKYKGRVLVLVLESGERIYLIEQRDFFMRDELYGTSMGDYPDNDKRFIFFQRAVLETLIRTKEVPDVIHCHDWQTGLIPAYLKTLYAGESIFSETASLFTIHNLAYQGNFPPDTLPLTGIGWDEFKFNKLEFYGKISFLKAGVVYADAVSTVSEQYAEEIQTEEFGCGFHDVLKSRKETLYGVVNGIDQNEWNPEKDKEIKFHFDPEHLENKAKNKEILQSENELDVAAKTPLIGFIARFVQQKGLDIVIPAVEELVALGAQLVFLGTGEEAYHRVLRAMGKKHRRHLRIHIVFDSKMAKQIYAGSDIMFWPSYYEPCGLGQMIAMRYGTVPVVRATGGLKDTVTEFNPKTGSGNGFLFEEYTSDRLVIAVKRAMGFYRQPEEWKKIVRNAMRSDFSWTQSAKHYEEIYQKTKVGK